MLVLYQCKELFDSKQLFVSSNCIFHKHFIALDIFKNMLDRPKEDYRIESNYDDACLEFQDQ